MTVDVVIAYQSLEPLREAAFERVHTHLSQLGWPITVAGDDHNPYRRALAVNRAVRETTADMLLLNDGDMICPLDQIREAVDMAASNPGVVFAFDDYIVWDQDGGVVEVLHEPPSNGCLAVSRSCFEELGGYNEGFVGWALEDREFNDRAARRWPLRRVEGSVDHIWHGERRSDGSCFTTSEEQVHANRILYQRLSAA